MLDAWRRNGRFEGPMSQAPDSLDAVSPRPDGEHSTSEMTELQPITLEGDVESPPQFDRVADVLGPLEQIVLAADQELGSIQQQVAVQAGQSSAEVDRRVREAAVEQRGRVAELRKELTDRVSELAGRFDALLSVLDEVDRELAVAAGDVRVTVTERQRVEISHEVPAAGGPAATAPPAKAAPTAIDSAEKTSKPRKEKGIRRWFRRSKRSSA